VRTPRGKGRADGALHEITPLQLGTQVLSALRGRNQLDTALVDDGIMSIVSPVGEQGAVLPRTMALAAGYAETVAGVQVNRFCGSGLEAASLATARVMSGMVPAAIAGGVESMSRVAMGSDGGSWPTDPAIAPNVHFVPQGISADLIAMLDGYSREDVDGFAVESQRRAAQAWAEKCFDRSILPVRDVIGQVVLDRDEHIRAGTTLQPHAGPGAAAAGQPRRTHRRGPRRLWSGQRSDRGPARRPRGLIRRNHTRAIRDIGAASVKRSGMPRRAPYHSRRPAATIRTPT
jgi:acetyl-CoA C-acetyltransferase